MKAIKNTAFTIILFLLLASLGYIAYEKYIDYNAQPTTTTTDIQGTIHDIGELATAEYDYQITQTTEKPSKTLVGIELPFTSSNVLYSYEGVIKAGIQFGKIEIDVKEAEKAIYVYLPKAEILSSQVKEESLTVYDENYSPFNTVTIADLNLGIQQLKETAESTAISKGVLDSATENAKSLIRSTIGSMYDTTIYEVKYC